MQRDRGRIQNTADYLSLNGYAPATVVEYLESIAGGPQTGKIIIADTIYNWSEDSDTPILIEVGKVQQDETKPRIKKWRIGKPRRFSYYGVNVSLQRPQSPPLSQPPPEPQDG